MISINIEEFPDSDCLNYPVGDSFKQSVLLHITQECDSHIDLVINGKNILNGYEGALVYPMYQFLMCMNHGLDRALKQNNSTIPIFLQQYNFSGDGPQHQLIVQVDADRRDMANLTFHWCKHVEPPEDLPSLEDEVVSLNNFVTAVAGTLRTYQAAVSNLLMQVGHGLAEETSGLFGGFTDLATAWSEFCSD